MFWSAPKLPITVDEKKWIEQNFLWLLEVFGKDYFLKKEMILPEARFFPDKFKGTEQCVTTLVGRVCGYMDIDPSKIDLYFTADQEDLAAKHRIGGDREQKSGAAGLYYGEDRKTSKWVIAINTSQFKNPTSLVGTIAHELGHVLLLGGRKISREEQDHEYLTDLLTVFMGMGIFTANSAFQFSQWRDHSHQVGKPPALVI